MKNTLLTELENLAKSDFFWTYDIPTERTLIPGVLLNFNWEDSEHGAVHLTIEIDTENDDLELIDREKFKYMEYLETLLGRSFSETTNSDACSFDFKFDTQHAGGPVKISCSITDYLS